MEFLCEGYKFYTVIYVENKILQQVKWLQYLVPGEYASVNS